MSEQLPSDLRYTKDHEWTKREAEGITVGITAFAVEQLGDITLVNLDVKVGDAVTEGKAFGNPPLSSAALSGGAPEGAKSGIDLVESFVNSDSPPPSNRTYPSFPCRRL